MFAHDLAIVGGCGHVGLPLGIAFAEAGLDVILYDISKSSVDMVNEGKMPFRENGANEALPKAIASGKLHATTDGEVLRDTENLVVVVGTPVDQYLNPDVAAVLHAIDPLSDYLVDDQLIVLRSTVYPGVTRLVERRLEEMGKKIDIAFCPERIAEGKALEELHSLPQIVSGRNDRVIERASTLFRHLTDDIVELEPEEAELAKLFTNTWRYIKFATANQLFMIANEWGLDFERIRHAITHNYPRAADMPGPGFAAGPCLFKDTMQIAAFNENKFTLGHASMMINEGLPLYIINRIEQRYDLTNMTIGILGMAFKGESDDARSSLSYKLKRVLRLKAKKVLCHDPYVTTDHDLVPLDQVMKECDLIIIAAPHKQYAGIDTTLPVIDVANVRGQGVKV